MKKILLPALLGGLFPILALAQSVADNARITDLSINEGYGGTVVFILLSPAPVGAPGCANSSWSYTFSLTAPGANQFYAMLLAAYVSGAPVDTVGAGSCNELNFIESLQTIHLTQ